MPKLVSRNLSDIHLVWWGELLLVILLDILTETPVVKYERRQP